MHLIFLATLTALTGCVEVAPEENMLSNDPQSLLDVMTDDCIPHLAVGMPGMPDQMICRDAFANGVNYTTKVADWSQYHITADSVSGYTARNDNFREDTDIPVEYRATLDDYYGTGYFTWPLMRLSITATPPWTNRFCSQT
jgi:DNA/RNA endonuclease G (NUC1)